MTNRSRSKLVASIGVMSLASVAAANGAMGPALQIFQFDVWFVYVVATIILEALLIGRSLGHTFQESLVFSTIWNAISSSCCASVPLHKSSLNPFETAVEGLIFFGIFSAVIEAGLWRIASQAPKRKLALKRSLLAHALGVPLALVILLIPSHPYPGLEATTNRLQREQLRRALYYAYYERFDDDGRLQQFKSAPDLARAVEDQDDHRAELCTLVFTRFDVERVPCPVEFNRAKIDYAAGDAGDRIWIAKIHHGKYTLTVFASLKVKQTWDDDRP